MIVQLDCQPADVSAHALGLRIDGPLPDVLAHTTLRGPRGALHLGIIGASHVASVYPAGALDTPVFREEMSCNVPGPLPSALHHERYAFAHQVVRCTPDELAQRVEVLDQSWLVARFPGLGPHHLTGVTGWWDDGNAAWEWHTLHCYPEEHTIVTTQSRYAL
ncbi:DUF2617 family protein [Corynebacterium sp.]|uniref:DUF2617 family protein n=1 Tax=Corynebacterium sp. TaxID=1720 RepID=UPI0026DD6711|nr:DUF2617 family protein [Corynebacterium sp.]MDO5076510.1 DUF2617 family protein [Corynebacterium sp.]